MICACYRHTNKLLLFILINFMVFGLKDFILGSVCFFLYLYPFVPDGAEKIVLKYLIFYVVIAAIQQLCAFLPQAIETILSIFTLFIRVMIPWYSLPQPLSLQRKSAN